MRQPALAHDAHGGGDGVVHRAVGAAGAARGDGEGDEHGDLPVSASADGVGDGDAADRALRHADELDDRPDEQHRRRAGCAA